MPVIMANFVKNGIAHEHTCVINLIHIIDSDTSIELKIRKEID